MMRRAGEASSGSSWSSRASVAWAAWRRASSKDKAIFLCYAALSRDMSDETQPAALPREGDRSMAGTAARGWRRYLRIGGYVLAALIAWPIVMTVVYTVVPPPFSNVMLLRALSGNGITKDWVSLDEISPICRAP